MSLYGREVLSARGGQRLFIEGLAESLAGAMSNGVMAMILNCFLNRVMY